MWTLPGPVSTNTDFKAKIHLVCWSHWHGWPSCWVSWRFSEVGTLSKGSEWPVNSYCMRLGEAGHLTGRKVDVGSHVLERKANWWNLPAGMIHCPGINQNWGRGPAENSTSLFLGLCDASQRGPAGTGVTAAGYLFDLGKEETGMTKTRLQDHVDIVKFQPGRTSLEAQCPQ